ncbi:putative hydroxymethylpyrimidine transporter CytX [Desulfosporosinus orientis DSM 765]|uniref:Putative hydroxymethylpyrimidine transporter CytX n=1 Tax=Desulfosporosinus orientis (strain ATCC 19365 / DSM 765 / NCIMB 8382 / VKM B-1628 / Singapore I) TaxID=768706 RepID=G7WDC4_DESOD|nr:putative hydroxymethylpyrimidine transporter CytX [Desulfosporosinus orientis]AET67609.1 putative hydroxymethylpyrimidine transporter CytX [Desulfosporosinus orientis DSM 765]
MNLAKNNLSMFNFATLWFGASISVAEILTGGLLAPLGFKMGVLAILLGHLVGTTILVLGGIIGTEARIAALESTRISFGQYGSYFFSILNVLQLLGWTAVMIIVGARSVNQISKTLWSFDHLTVWSLLIGILIMLWLWLGKDSGWKKLNYVAVVLLFLLTLVLSSIIAGSQELFSGFGAGEMSFGSAVELAVVMPLSWLPLIADYTRFAKTRRSGAWGSWLGYFVGSSWMYIIGLGAGIIASDADPSAMLLAANLGLVALGIIVLSTVTTTFLDAYSAGVSFLNIFPRFNEKVIALVMTAIGTGIAVVVNIEEYESFLYAIGSVFAPLFAILLTDYFLLNQKKIQPDLLANWESLLLCAAGTVLYYQFINYDFIMGATIPVMVIISIIHFIIGRFTEKWKFVSKSSKA